MQITYLFDPLCGWCYGAGPALEKLAEIDGISLRLAPTGLFAGENARPMDPSFAAYAWQNDQRIARLTGQSFSELYRSDVLGRTGTIFDSAPATLGVVAVALTEPQREIETLKTLQHARYVAGRNICHLSAVAEILSDSGLKEAALRVLSPDDDLLGTYRHRVDAARAMMTGFDARGVPSLIVEDATGSRLLPSAALFGNFEALTEQLRAT